MTHWRGERAVSVILHNEFKCAVKKILPIFLSLVGSGGLAFLTQILLGRSLTVDDFGAVSTALSIVVIMTPLIGFGMPSVLLLMFGQEGRQAFRWVRHTLMFSFIWGLIVLAISWGALVWLIEDERLLRVTLWMQAMVVMQVIVELLAAKLQLEARYVALSLWQGLPHLGRLSVALITYLSAPAGVDMVAKGFFLVSLVLIAIAGYGLTSMSASKMCLAGPQREDTAPAQALPITPSYSRLLSVAWPYAGGAALVMFYGRIEIVLLGTTTSATAAGQFSIATAFLLVAFLIPQAVYQKFLLPKIHRWFHHEWERFLAVYRFGCASMAVIGLAGTIAAYTVGEPLVVLFFGEKYRVAGQVLSLLSICILTRFVSTSIGSSLVSGACMKYKVCCQSLTTLVTTPSAYILIALYGIDGAIMNKILTEILLLVSYTYASARYVLGINTWTGWSLKMSSHA